MKTGVFYRMLQHGFGSKETRIAMECTGLIDEENQIAYIKQSPDDFHYMSENWIATDMLTGFRIAYGSTKKECIEAAKQNFETLHKLRTENSDGSIYVDYSGQKEVLQFLIEQGKEMRISRIKKMMA